ncbi:hypothetical protein Vadar_030723 [Vaccinium darrowii]|uniref:Uncharacterized protein n=1 Tax=Vaccinium darrowii TaxID=229202 RepID=A0ACB7ZFL6_9ERIC|nr:hypothetical protein Vadar_030723 [Vaccinium darrowii]
MRVSLSLQVEDTSEYHGKIEGSWATAKQTGELLRSVISQHRMPHVNQAGALIDAIKLVGEQLIAANPVGILPWEKRGKFAM